MPVRLGLLIVEHECDTAEVGSSICSIAFMTRNAFLFLTMLLGTWGLACAGTTPPSGEPSPIAWGAVANGLQGGVSATQTTVAAGASLMMNFIVRNVSDVTQSLPVPSTGTVTWTLNDSLLIGARPGQPDAWIDLAAGDSITYQASLALDEQGMIRITATLAPRSAAPSFSALSAGEISVKVK